MKNTYTLNNGLVIPSVGFGTYKLTEDGEVIRQAVDAGYRYFDTASFYENEEILGRALGETGLKREEYYLASKAWKTQMGYHQVKEAFQESLDKLGTDYLDLYLIHWPLPEEGYENWKELDLETWRAMEELYKEGKVRAIGVSNFMPRHLLNLIEHASVVPAVNQIEFHPGYTQEFTVNFCKENGILVQAWKPLCRGAVLENTTLCQMADKYQVSASKLCLKYAIQRGVMPLPKSSSPERMRANLEIMDFQISTEDMYRISAMSPIGWNGQHPDGDIF